jgi:pimeloyl-ACP methyl ester carboxylesterase
VVFPGIGMTNANPTGIQRWGEVRLLSPLARAFTVYRVGRRVGLKPGTTIADLANDYAVALEGEFGGPVDVLGISMGGSIALQLGVDRPAMLRRLVVAGAAFRLASADESSSAARPSSRPRATGAGSRGCKPQTSPTRASGDGSPEGCCGSLAPCS